MLPLVRAASAFWVWPKATSVAAKTFGRSPKTPSKKRNFRALWIARINAGARMHGLSYSQLMGKLHANNIELNRKVLADLAMNHPEAFKAVVEKVK